MRIVSAIFVITVSALVSCRKPTSLGVSGNYIAKYSHGTDELCFREDGTFAQRFTFKGGSIATNSGIWIGPTTNDQVLVQRFVMFDDGFGRPHHNPVPGYVSLCYEVRGGRVSLGFNKGLENVYEKQ